MLSTIHSLSTLTLQKCGGRGVFHYIVDNTMLSSYHTLSYIASDLKPRLEGHAVVEAFSQERDQLVLRFDCSNDGLIIACDREMNTLRLRRDATRARTNSVDVLPSIIGRRIEAIEMHPRDRVMMFSLESGKRLDLCFFGARANVVLVDETGTVVDAFKQPKQLIGSKMEYQSGELVYDIDAWWTHVSETPAETIAASLKRFFPTLGSTLVRELLHRAQVSPTRSVSAIHDEHLQVLRRALAALLQDLSAARPRVYLVEKNGKGFPVAFSLVPLTHLPKNEERPFDDIHEAIRFFVAFSRSHVRFEKKKRALLDTLIRRMEKLKRTHEVLEDELKKSNRTDEYQRFGTLLMQHAHLVHRGEKEVVIEHDGMAMHIPLHPSLTAVQNAQRYFEKAKRALLAHHQASARLVSLNDQIDAVQRLTQALDDASTTEELKAFMEEHKDDLERIGIGGNTAERERLPFRIFTVDGGFEVWAGKSSRDNDELTLKHAKPNDLWFHVRGASGSHVILKIGSGKGEPSKKAKEQAAAIAAYYSKMRNAKHVPVAMTERKYVRKPRGAAPGSVIVEREKIIFAEPALPHEDATN